ncbi:MAG: valine--tRNA ligase [Actinobacteria bacterium]|nr:valine--tRNA ligase [Actinomycetota bacterium]
MKEMPKAYDPAGVEARIFSSWMQGRYFEQPVREEVESFAVVIPPPNITGSLHMGHALNNTIQDVVVRRMRMAGRSVRWVLGTDHAGIATQNKVEQKLAAQGASRHDLGREAFIEACWEWRREHGSTIILQLKAMGCSCDYSDEWFTMDPGYQRAVRKVFVDWYEAGLIYRGERIINWCPRCSTALSDIEVEHEEMEGRLWHLKYPLVTPVDGIEYVVVATTRPETMLGDTCVAVHPEDPRYRALVGAAVTLPLIGREIPIVADEHVDPAFGSGAVKVTPAHDPNDFEIGLRHGCAAVNILNADASISSEGGKYAGLDRYEARARIVADLEAAGLVAKIEDHSHSAGHCYRCHTVIEPWLSDQWFVDMKPLAAPAIEAARDGRVTFHPKRWESVYYHWMENIRDWCISRQLWWGHRIPVFYCDSCAKAHASVEDLVECPDCAGPVSQDEDVLDTWFSSQLWPFATFGWPDKTPELDYFYPTSVLSTARDILFLWVARMIMSGMYCVDGKVPFSDVIIHPTVFNPEGKRMSKSLGTGIDPLDLMAHYGADGMRFGLMLQVSGNQDIRFAEEKLASSRNFANKIWNASRFVLMNIDDSYLPGKPCADTFADAWILSRLATVASEVDDSIASYRFGDAARSLYDFVWSEFCDWYIELSKSRLLAGTAEDADEAAREARLTTQRNLVFVLDSALRLLHPMMPFITEEIWRRLPLEESARAESLMIAAWPDTGSLSGFHDTGAERAVFLLREVVSAIRNIRARYAIPPRDHLDLIIKASAEDALMLKPALDGIVALATLGAVTIDESAERPPHSASAVVATAELFVPLEGLVDFEAERERVSKQLEKATDELEKIERKLSNEGFLAKAAPEIIEKDRSKATELKDAIAAFSAQLTEIS